ncbi:MAG: DNA-3-methyladenine glycosylase 2 family protein, partial [Acidisphaera sp.]|nr:DNA-3-methyladenine glycosylase 2 family protein [Acidisphaera sp.]
DGFELAVRAILGQQITVSAATALAGKLVALCGTRLLPAAASPSHVFPTPEQIAAVDDLGAALGMPRRRAAAIAALARSAAADPGLFEPGRGLDETVAALRVLPGIGEWTAQYIAMRALREPDAFPAADIGLLRATATADGRPTPAQLLARAAAWRPWRAYAALHLWAAGAVRPDPATPKGDFHEPAPRSRPLADRRDSAGL